MRSHVTALVVFVLLTLVMTYPLVTMLDSGVRDNLDCLLNAWILSWDVHQLGHLDLEGLFDANVFHPYTNTLAYSEHLLPEALVAMVPLVLSGNPILAYNVVLLLSIIANGFAMYLYARYLTGSWTGAVTAGMVFAFSPFMFDHLSHLQVFAAAGIPLAFWLLARFFARERWTDLALLGVVVALQLLANGYYAVFLSFFLGVTVAVHVLLAGKLREPVFLAKLAVLALIVAGLAGPVLARYVRLQRETGYRRESTNHAELSSFLRVPGFNRLYGRGDPDDSEHNERRLFPGLVAVALAAAGLGVGRRRAVRTGKTEEGPAPGRHGTARRIQAGAIALAALLVLLLILLGERFPLSVVIGWLVLLAAAVTALLVVDPDLRRRALAPLTTPRSWRRLHVVILVVAFLCSFGRSIAFPYPLLYELVPGFDGLRAVPRIHVFTMFALAALAAMGMERLEAWRRSGTARAAVVLVPVLIVAEYISVPLPLREAPVGEHVPRVYHWLAEAPDEGAVLELPMPTPRGKVAALECPRMLFSTLHWKPLVNGYSGHIPPLYDELRLRWVSQSVVANIEDARRLGVRYLVLDLDRFRNPEWRERVRAVLGSMPQDQAVRAYHDQTHEVWLLAPPEAAVVAVNAPPGALRLERETWRATASASQERAGAAIDGAPETCWDSGTAEPGSWLAVDLGQVETVRGLTLVFRGARNSFPRAWSAEVSVDGTTWNTVARGRLENLPITAFIVPSEPQLAIAFPAAVRARHVRLTNAPDRLHRFWAVCELELWR